MSHAREGCSSPAERLHENDFVMARKIDRLLDRPDGSLDHKQ